MRNISEEVKLRSIFSLLNMNEIERQNSNHKIITYDSL